MGHTAFKQVSVDNRLIQGHGQFVKQGIPAGNQVDFVITLSQKFRDAGRIPVSFIIDGTYPGLTFTPNSWVRAIDDRGGNRF